MSGHLLHVMNVLNKLGKRDKLQGFLRISCYHSFLIATSLMDSIIQTGA